MKITPGVRRLGIGLVNAYLLEEAGAVTIIDTGVPGYWRDLPAELAAMGRTLADVRAVLLTHGHSDHLGFAERIRRERGVLIRVHELDAALATGKAKNPSKGLGPFRVSSLLGFLWYTATHGGLRIETVAVVATFGDGATLNVPGTPRVILVPGHTPGSAALHVASRDVLFTGDAIATRSVTTGAIGPQLAPFTASLPQALASLARLEGVEASVVLPGHGDPWNGGVAAALAKVRARGPNLAR